MSSLQKESEAPKSTRRRKPCANASEAEFGAAIPLGLPDQVNDLPTAPSDRGDETQDRFRYQSAIGVVLLAEGITQAKQITAIWCEHHEDFLVEMLTGKYVAVQVKTNSGENAKWSVSDDALVNSLARFCALESQHTSSIDGYEFCSNAPFYVPAASAKSEKKLSSSPIRLLAACRLAESPASIPEPYKTSFHTLVKLASVDALVLFGVLRKLAFRQGPPLRGYQDTLIARVIPNLPGCASLPNLRLHRISAELMRLVESASGVPTGGLDGVLEYIASNGKPQNSIRGKCITVDSARTSVDQAKQLAFRFIGYGDGLPIGHVAGQENTLRKKMRNAYLDSQFEPMWRRAIAAEKRLMERALADPEGFDEIANQLEGAVLTECMDIEASFALEPDEKKRGLGIYKEVLNRLSTLAIEEPAKVENEPKDTLLGVAGMLSGSCRFAWGVPLSGEENGT
jgi:hypothetical protein